MGAVRVPTIQRKRDGPVRKDRITVSQSPIWNERHIGHRSKSANPLKNKELLVVAKIMKSENPSDVCGSSSQALISPRFAKNSGKSVMTTSRMYHFMPE